jgi:hypothetical protein
MCPTLDLHRLTEDADLSHVEFLLPWTWLHSSTMSIPTSMVSFATTLYLIKELRLGEE